MDTFDCLNKLDCKEYCSSKRNDISSRARHASNSSGSFIDKVAESLDTMERELDLVSSLTGISFEKTESITLKQDRNGIVKKHNLRGYCHQLPFKVKYNIRFSKLPDENVDYQAYEISDIHLKVGTELAKEELEPILIRIKQTLEGVYRTLHSYTKKDKERREYFEKLMEDFPGCVHQNSGNSIKVSHLSKQGMSCIFTWKIVLNENGEFTHHVSLDATHNASEALSHASEKLLDQTPELFETLKTTIGQKNAMKLMVDLVTKLYKDDSDMSEENLL